jgi:hypothetical protein
LVLRRFFRRRSPEKTVAPPPAVVSGDQTLAERDERTEGEGEKENKRE